MKTHYRIVWYRDDGSQYTWSEDLWPHGDVWRDEHTGVIHASPKDWFESRRNDYKDVPVAKLYSRVIPEWSEIA